MRPLQNYTALKLQRSARGYPPWFETPTELHCSQTAGNGEECIASLRPLQNYTALKRDKHLVTLPQGLRPLQNYTALKRSLRLRGFGFLFETPTELHCSQTWTFWRWLYPRFETPTELHCSQTQIRIRQKRHGLRPLQNYTALKQSTSLPTFRAGLRPLQNYTALKRFKYSLCR